MKHILHKANTRGHANYGWLDTWYTFSFANYYNPERIHFGTLRVINDDSIAGGQGFGKHPHDNMEIITIPLEGELEHQDSMGHTMPIKPNEVQVMSAGTGLYHSEFNRLKDVTLKLLQIWVFPARQNVPPRYDQKEFDPVGRVNSWQYIVAPDVPGALTINQNAWFSMVSLEKGNVIDYTVHDSKNGMYLFLIEGSISVEEIELNRRDGLGIWETSAINIKATDSAQLLLMEIPMEINT